MADPTPPKKPAPPVNSLKPFGVTPGYVVRGKLDPKTEMQRKWDDELDKDPDLSWLSQPIGTSSMIDPYFKKMLMEAMMDRADPTKIIQQQRAQHTRAAFSEVERLLEKAQIPSAQGDMPIDALIAQVKDRLPQAAADLASLKEASINAQLRYVEFATTGGIPDDDAMTPLSLLGPEDHAVTANSLRAFIEAADNYL